MAYLPQNQIDLQNQQQNSQVLSNQAQQGQPLQGQNVPVGGASQSSMIEGSNGAPQQNAPTAKKASSGQFTNLKSYLQANQGAGQKIGQQLTGGLTKTAQQIGDVVNQQKQQYQAQVQQQEAQRAQAGQHAQQVLQQAQNARNATSLPKQEDISMFRDLATGNKTFQDVQDMNLAQQQLQQQELARKAEALKTFEGRSGQLKETFGKQKQYGLGSQQLDNLLLQSQGLQDTLGRAKTASQSSQEALKGADVYGRNELARLIADNQAFSQGLQQQAETGQTGVISDLDARQAAIKAQREKEVAELINPTLAAQKKELADLANYYGGENVRQRLVDQAKQALGANFNQSINNEIQTQARQLAESKVMSFEDFKKQNPPRNIEQATRLQNDYNQYRDQFIKNTMQSTMQGLQDPKQAEKLRQQFLQNYVSTGASPRLITNQHDWDWRVNQTIQNALKMDPDTLKNLGMSQKDIDYVNNAAGVGGKYVSTDLINQFLNKAQAGITSQQKALPQYLSDEIKKATGYDYNTYSTGKDLSRESIASDAERARYAALSSLAGKQAADLQLNRTTPAAAKAFQGDALKELLANLSSKYGKSGLSGAPKGVASLAAPKVNIG